MSPANLAHVLLVVIDTAEKLTAIFDFVYRPELSDNSMLEKPTPKSFDASLRPLPLTAQTSPTARRLIDSTLSVIPLQLPVVAPMLFQHCPNGWRQSGR